MFLKGLSCPPSSPLIPPRHRIDLGSTLPQTIRRQTSDHVNFAWAQAVMRAGHRPHRATFSRMGPTKRPCSALKCCCFLQPFRAAMDDPLHAYVARGRPRRGTMISDTCASFPTSTERLKKSPTESLKKHPNNSGSYVRRSPFAPGATSCPPKPPK